MAILTITRNTTLPDSADKSDFHNLVDTATLSISNIVDADIDGAAAIADSKLAQIITAGKVDGSALTGLANIPSGAGQIPAVNVNSMSDADGDTKIQVEETADADEIVGKTAGVECLRFHANGILDLAKQSRSRAYLSTVDQSIPDITWTKIELNAESYDNQNEFDSTTNYRFTATEAGYYFASGKIVYTAVVDQKNYIVAIYKNGIRVSQKHTNASGTARAGVAVSDVIYLAEGDYLELWTYHDSGATKYVIYNSWLTFLTIHKLS